MSRPADHRSEMSSRSSSGALSEADADALLSGRALAGHDDLREIIGLMKTASAVPAPAPTAALAAVLRDGFDPLPVAPVPTPGRSRRWGVRIAVAAAAALTATLAAATANALPAPIQNAVADVVGAVTPLQLPRPSGDGGTGIQDDDGSSDEPSAVPSAPPEEDLDPADPAPAVPETAPRSPKAPAAVPPPRRPAPTATVTADPDDDGPDVDDADVDEPATDEPDTDEPGTEDADVDEPDSAEQEIDEDAAPEQDEPEAED